MQCKNCGATNRQGAKFCNTCGVKLPVIQSIQQVQPAQPIHQVKSRQVFPPAQPVRQIRSPQPAQQAQYRHGVQPVTPGEVSKPGLLSIVNDLKWIIVIYVFLVLCCGTGVFFLGYRTNWILWKLGLR